MAGLPWFELDVDMPDDPKCVNLGVRLKNALAFGYVVRLYAYCYRHGTDTFSGTETIETAAGWRGKPGVLFAALDAEGFLDRGQDTFSIHGVSKRLGPHLAKRERDAVRARERRAEAEAGIGRPSRGRRGDVAATDERDPRDVRGDRDKDRDSDRDPIGSLQPRIVSVLTGGAGGKA